MLHHVVRYALHVSPLNLCCNSQCDSVTVSLPLMLPYCSRHRKCETAADVLFVIQTLMIDDFRLNVLKSLTALELS